MWGTSVGLMESNLRHTEVLRGDESKKECVGDEDEGKAGRQGSRLWLWCSTLGSAAAPWALLLLDPTCWAEQRARQKFSVCSRRLRPND